MLQPALRQAEGAPEPVTRPVLELRGRRPLTSGQSDRQGGLWCKWLGPGCPAPSREPRGGQAGAVRLRAAPVLCRVLCPHLCSRVRARGGLHTTTGWTGGEGLRGRGPHPDPCAGFLWTRWRTGRWTRALARGRIGCTASQGQRLNHPALRPCSGRREAQGRGAGPKPRREGKGAWNWGS